MELFLLAAQVNAFAFGKLMMCTSLELLGPEEMKSAGERLSLNIPPQMRINFRCAGMQMVKSLPMG
jgi:hypothetical protein